MTRVNDGWDLSYINGPISVTEYDELRKYFPVRGDYVQYTGTNGYDSDREYAEKFMILGQILTVEGCDIGGSTSFFIFKELPSKRFNTVMFKKVSIVS